MSKITLKLPKLHNGQQHIKDNHKRFTVVSAGRRFGKNVLADDIIINHLLNSKIVSYIEPTYKMLSETWRNINYKVKPLITSSNSQEFRLTLKTGGVIEFWSLENFDSIRGRKYHCTIINEAAMFKHLEEAWTQVIRPTLTDYKGEGWFLSTPRGDNYFKELFNTEKVDRENWCSFTATSYDNPKLDKKEIDDAKKQIPDVVFKQEYLATFLGGQGTLVNKYDLKYFNESEVVINELDIMIGVDLAISQKSQADYTAIAVLGKNKNTGNIYIIDVYRNKLSFQEILRQIEKISNKYRAKVIGIEQVAFQAAVIQELLRTTNLNIKGVRPDKDKVTRFHPILSRIEQGYVYLNNNLIPEFTKELLGFPLATHDDMVDAVTLAYNLFNKTEQGFTF